jgi:hydrogenase expression/formation protein HypC
MCLGVPAKIEKIEGDFAIADFDGIKRKISIQLTPDIKINEYCLVHAGFAIEKITKAYAKELKDYLKEMFNESNNE